MEGEEIDLCECVWQKEAMQRLISLLRQTQSHCTENECYPVSRLPGPQSDQSSADVFFMTIIFGVMALLYAFRPNSLRQNRLDDTKNRDNAPGSNGDPPAPPPASN